MRRRLTIAICGMVAAALLAAGLGTLALSRLGARDATRKDLERQASAFAQVFEELGEPQIGGQPRTTPLLARQRLQQVASTLKLEDIGFLVAGPNLDYRGDIPAGIALADLKPERLRNDHIVTGYENGKVFAAAPGFYERTLANGQRERVGGFVVVITSKPASVAPPAVRWFLLASIGTLLLGALVAFRLTRTLTKPVVAASATAHRIATGDLAARVPEPPADATDELSELSRSINAMATGLERSRGLERQFLMSVSHDLRTPMASIQGYAEALVDEAIDPRRAGDVILAESKRLDRLVTDLLLLSRLDARSFTFDVRVVDAGSLVAATVSGFVPRAQERGVTLMMHPSPTPATAVADGDRLGQAIANLLENALKFARQRIDVSLRSEGGWIVLSIADDGPGIAPEDLPHVFERLYVARHRPTPKESGSGLGLAIVREIIEAMGGHVTARSPIPHTAAGTEMLIALRPA
jgi:two-component system sensor histidine kinase BaeS